MREKVTGSMKEELKGCSTGSEGTQTSHHNRHETDLIRWWSNNPSVPANVFEVYLEGFLLAAVFCPSLPSTSSLTSNCSIVIVFHWRWDPVMINWLTDWKEYTNDRVLQPSIFLFSFTDFLDTAQECWGTNWPWLTSEWVVGVLGKILAAYLPVPYDVTLLLCQLCNTPSLSGGLLSWSGVMPMPMFLCEIVAPLRRM